MTKNIVDPRMELPTQIEELANKICVQINEIEVMEESLSKAGKNKEKWLQELAELLDGSGYSIGSKIFLKNGRKMLLKEFFSSSLPSQSSIDRCKDPEKRADLEARKLEGLEWLDKSGLGDVIKNNIVAILPRGNQELAKELAEILEQKQVSYVREESVHAMTLNATLKEQMKKGTNVPFETFGVITGTKVEIK